MDRVCYVTDCVGQGGAVPQKRKSGGSYQNERKWVLPGQKPPLSTKKQNLYPVEEASEIEFWFSGKDGVCLD